MPQITANFAYAEFKPNGAPNTWLPENDYQNFLIKTLAANLQIVSNAMPKGCSISITNSVRTIGDYNRLKSQGYHPSETSDHFCGASITLSKDSSNRHKFGPNYYFSVGAADVISSGIDLKTFFDIAIGMTKSGVCKFGQLIFETDPIKGSKWVHFANDYSSIFSDAMVKFLGREKYLTTNDGGKTYVPYIS